MNILSGDLERTATYAGRRWSWVENPDKTRPGEHHDGKLTITLQKGARPGCKVEADTYCIEEEPPVGFVGRAFLLVNLSDESQPDVYRSRIGDRADDWACTCKAGSCGLLCKHVESLRAVVAEGGLPDPRTEPTDEVDLPACFRGVGGLREGVPF